MFDEKIKFKYPWRPYQERVLRESDKFLRDGKINVVAAPGSGKTILGLELARRMNKAVLILAPTVTIKKQWVSKFISLFTEYSEIPDWISTDIYNLKFFNVVTYQALHYAYKRKKLIEKSDETDDLVNDEEEIIPEEKIKIYDVVAELKNKNIKTFVLDEAHHLKSEWWKSLNEVLNTMENIKIISLTATPPYDVEPNIWKNYVSLCGEIDSEISVPELVKAKNLCPHQDYIYFNYPTDDEIYKIKEYDNKLNNIITEIKNNPQFIDAIYNHKFIREPYKWDEEILEKPEYYSSMLIFLNACNRNISSANTNVLAYNSKLPEFDLQWFEILLKNVIIEDRKNYEEYDAIISEYEQRLNEIGAIEKKKISLADNKTIQKYFVNSLGKLNSIVEIVNIERNTLKENMRMVILTDYIRKEYLTNENIEIDKIGVLPIFKKIQEQYTDLSMAILTGSLFVIPKNEFDNLLEECTLKNLNTEKIKAKTFVLNDNYVELVMPEAIRNDVMSCISKLFEIGKINLIIGTKSLLGEGWDEPAINSLILATFVGSYMLSNQMRGRAIRVNDDPRKTANIWHLVCICDNLNQEESIENTDLNLLKRRFKSFVGIGYNDSNVSSGLERLGDFNAPYTLDKIRSFNNIMKENSNSREKMFNNWQTAVINQPNDIKMTEEIELEEPESFETDWLVSKKLKTSIFIAVILLALLIMGIGPRLLTLIVEICLLIYIIISVKRIKRLSNPEETVKAIAEVLLEQLIKTRNINTPFSKMKLRTSNYNGKVSVWLEGATLQECNIFITCLSQIFSKIESQRYILSTRKMNFKRYYNIPKVFSNNKENALSFASTWNRKIGKVEVIYTKNVEGRKQLLKARMQYLDLKDKMSRKQKLLALK